MSARANCAHEETASHVFTAEQTRRNNRRYPEPVLPTRVLLTCERSGSPGRSASAGTKEERCEHVAGCDPWNDAVLDAVAFVHDVSVVARSASRVGLSRVGQLPLAFASANHTFRTITPEGFDGDENQQILVRSSGDATMWVAIEVNLALWGMILCAAVQAGERFAIY